MHKALSYQLGQALWLNCYELSHFLNSYLTKLTECVNISSADNVLYRDTYLSLSGSSDPGCGFLKIRIYPLSGKVPMYENSMNLTGNK